MLTTGMSRPSDQPGGLTVPEATQFIRSSGERLIATLDGAGKAADKRQQLVALLDEAVDVDGIARFALGRFWNTASDGQRDAYLRLFSAVLVDRLCNAFDDYHGMHFSIDRVTQADDAVQVVTSVYRPNQATQRVVWIVGAVAGVTKIVDIVAEGLSVRIMQRDHCVKLLQQDGYSIEGLIGTLRQQSGIPS
jgi:phospholipid transport system substrate-binding protein